MKAVLCRSGEEVILLFLIAAITSTQVKNNVEIRLALGLFSVLILYRSQFWSGVFSSLSLFVSLEVGLACLLVNFLHTGYLCKRQNKIKPLSYLLAGLLLPTTLILGYLFFTNSLVDYFQQTTYYARAFSLGYFSLPVDRAISMSHFHWHLFYQYLNSTAFFWELTLGLLLVGFLRGIQTQSNLRVALATFGFLILRSALGRSDYYHLLFPLIISLIVLVAELQSIKALPWLIIFTCLLIFRSEINSVFLENIFYRFQTYGHIPGDYKELGRSRGGILVDKETMPDDKNKLYEYIIKNTSSRDGIFVFPWAPEIYFLTNRSNPTPNDTPYAFFDEKFQEETVKALQSNPPKLIIYSPNFNFGNQSISSLPLIAKYITDNFQETTRFDIYQVLTPK